MRQFLSTLIITFCMLLLMINSFCEGMRFSDQMPMPMEVLMITAICVYVIHNGYLNTVEIEAKRKRIKEMKEEQERRKAVEAYNDFRRTRSANNCDEDVW